MDDYRLVSCDFYDELEALATLRQECQIVYRDENDEVMKVRSRIVDVYSSNQADFLKLTDGATIRLDRLVSVNDKQIAYITD